MQKWFEARFFQRELVREVRYKGQGRWIDPLGDGDLLHRLRDSLL